jgi:hypothetical protein
MVWGEGQTGPESPSASVSSPQCGDHISPQEAFVARTQTDGVRGLQGLDEIQSHMAAGLGAHGL